MEAANGVKNMSLAHEIAVNNDFQIEKLQPEQNSIEKRVREVMHKAFWDALEAKLSDDPPDYSHAMVLIEEVKESLLSLLLPQHVRLRTQVLEVFDMDLIRQKMENDAFDIFFYANYVIGTMARLCAPVRDEHVARLRELKEVVPLFKEIFEVLDLMKMDMANFTIQQMRPYLQQQSVDYERKKFNEFLKTQEENGTDGLECTRLWLKRNFERLLAEENTANDLAPTSSSPPPLTSFPSSSSSSSGPSKATPAAILNEAYMDTLNWDQSQIYPETLVMDRTRFCELESKCHMLTTIASVQLVTYSTVGAPIAGIQSLKQTLKSHVQTLLEGGKGDMKEVLMNAAEQVKKDVNECLVEHGFSQLDDEKKKLLEGQICDLASPTNAISNLMKQRVMHFIKESIPTRRMEPLKVPVGFSAVETELSQILGQFLRLISHNRSVFGPYYSDIISQLLQRQQDLSPR
ncbi:hypothetical protein BaRGS_00005545 [Batillaria attramentaria]|uniref:T-complex protein 11-like protein 1 n=1 Tax=Batillaria attramentaria TaxID=370345 RepID=A0ABD0LVU0_9CAEN